MATGEGIIRVMKELAVPGSDSTDIVYGVVTSINPLKIRLDRIEIVSDFILLSSMVKKKLVNGILLWDDLKVGETVVMIRANRGQLYYVLDRG